MSSHSISNIITYHLRNLINYRAQNENKSLRDQNGKKY